MKAKLETKRCEYAYPTSPNAVQFGFGKTGCYTVQLVKRSELKPAKAIAAFATLDAAHKYADLMPQPWDRLTK